MGVGYVFLIEKMMLCWVILIELVFQIVFYCDPINYKLALSDPVPDPIEPHINSSVSVLVYVVIEKSVSCFSVCDSWCE